MEEKYWDYYSDNKEEILREFREQFPKDEMPENDDDLWNWYEKELEEMIIDWYEQEEDWIETKNSLK